VTIIRILPLTLLILGSVGCTNDNSKWVGTWKGTNKDLVADDIAAKDPIIAESIRLVKLEIKSNSTFVLERAGFPHSGSITFGSQKSTLRIEKILDRPLDQVNEETKKQNPNITLEWVDSNTIRLIDPADFGRDEIILTR